MTKLKVLVGIQERQEDNHAIDMNSSEDYDNPVRNGIVTNAKDYLYSSACDYYGKQGLLLVEIIN